VNLQIPNDKNQEPITRVMGSCKNIPIYVSLVHMTVISFPALCIVCVGIVMCFVKVVVLNYSVDLYWTYNQVLALKS